MANRIRAILIIIDGVGIGELPDAHIYGDQGSNTLANLAKAVGGFELPNLEALGLGKIHPIAGLRDDMPAAGAYGKMAEISPGKDSTTGHWELAGHILRQAFPTYPDGFPQDLLAAFEEETGRGVLGNKAASGTEIIKELGEEHLKTGKLIVYTSADSVFQIAAHEEVVPLDELYRYCELARALLKGKHAVARVIARPFIGTRADDFTRTKGRRDFSLKPNGPILLQNLQNNNIPTVGIGKIHDLYAGVGIGKVVSSKTNAEGMAAVLQQLDSVEEGLIMVNLVDFDMLWGHRNDTDGFYRGLMAFDRWLISLQKKLGKNDIVIITADHGNDPTTPSTDHSREYVPIPLTGEKIVKNSNIGSRKSFADLQATLAEYFGIASTGAGESFYRNIFYDITT